jgi:hypothetical protein
MMRGRASRGLHGARQLQGPTTTRMLPTRARLAAQWAGERRAAGGMPRHPMGIQVKSRLQRDRPLGGARARGRSGLCWREGGRGEGKRQLSWREGGRGGARGAGAVQVPVPVLLRPTASRTGMQTWRQTGRQVTSLRMRATMAPVIAGIRWALGMVKMRWMPGGAEWARAPPRMVALLLVTGITLEAAIGVPRGGGVTWARGGLPDQTTSTEDAPP